MPDEHQLTQDELDGKVEAALAALIPFLVKDNEGSWKVMKEQNEDPRYKNRVEALCREDFGGAPGPLYQ